MVKIVAIILTGIILVSILGSAIFMGVKMSGYMINQKFNFHDAWNWALQDLQNWIESIQPKTESEVKEYPFVNQNIEVVACTAL